VTFFDELISPFISPNAPTNQKDFAFGQIFCAPVYYPHQILQIWRPKDLDQKLHTATDFNIKTTVPDAFRRTVPYTNPYLATNEEFIALRAKKRPVILIQPPDPSLIEVKGVSKGIKLDRHLCVVAPAFSLEDAVGYQKATVEFIARVRRLDYSQFLFVPKGGPMTVDSFVRLDELQSVAIQHLEPTGCALSPEALATFRAQVSFFLGGLDGGDFAEYRRLLADG
jgi:hypothetical protein